MCTEEIMCLMIYTYINYDKQKNLSANWPKPKHTLTITDSFSILGNCLPISMAHSSFGFAQVSVKKWSYQRTWKDREQQQKPNNWINGQRNWTDTPQKKKYK